MMGANKSRSGEDNHMDTTDSVAVTRQDGETVGYLQPLDPGFEAVQGRSWLGDAIEGPAQFIEAEELSLERGMDERAGPWPLGSEEVDVREDLVILEDSAHGIVRADAMLTKALVPAARS